MWKACLQKVFHIKCNRITKEDVKFKVEQYIFIYINIRSCLMRVLKWGQPSLTKKLHDLMAPSGRFKYSSVLQLASDGSAWHEFIHKHLNPGLSLHICACAAQGQSGALSLSANINTSAFNQIFHRREDMSGRWEAGTGLRMDCKAGVRYPVLPLGGGHLQVSVSILQSWELVSFFEELQNYILSRGSLNVH